MMCFRPALSKGSISGRTQHPAEGLGVHAWQPPVQPCFRLLRIVARGAAKNPPKQRMRPRGPHQGRGPKR